MAKKFRSSIRGFNRKDVVNYLEEFSKEKAEQIKEKDTRISELEREITLLDETQTRTAGVIDENKELRTSVEDLKNEKIVLEETLRQEAHEKDLLKNRIAQMEEQVASKNAELDEKISEKESELYEALQDREQRFKTLLADKEDQLTGLKEKLRQLEEENASLKKHNLRLIEEAAKAEKTKTTPPIRQKAEELTEEVRRGAGNAQELLAVCKQKLLEISEELASLAQTVLDAERRANTQTEESWDEYDYDQQDLGAMAEDHRRKNFSLNRGAMSVREILDLIKAIGDKLL